jgi:hypothetical protein
MTCGLPLGGRVVLDGLDLGYVELRQKIRTRVEKRHAKGEEAVPLASQLLVLPAVGATLARLGC